MKIKALFSFAPCPPLPTARGLGHAAFNKFLKKWRSGACLRVGGGFALALFLLSADPSWAKPRIVLDAAHGGSDTGVKAGSEVEKDWNARIVQALQKKFEEAGFDVVLVRKGDSTLAPEKRTEAINTSQASAAIIVHADREWSGAQRGPYLVVEPPSRLEPGESTEILRWGFTSPAQYHSSLRMARILAQKLGVNAEFSNLSDSRGLGGETPGAEGRIFCLPHQSLRSLTLPAVVLTPLFLTSPADRKKFSQAGPLEDFADRVVRATAEFLQVSP